MKHGMLVGSCNDSGRSFGLPCPGDRVEALVDCVLVTMVMSAQISLQANVVAKVLFTHRM